MIDSNLRDMRFSQIKDRKRRCSSAGLHCVISEDITLKVSHIASFKYMT